MLRLAWLTDVHLDFLDDSALDGFLAEVSRLEADALAVTGDIAQAGTIVHQLERLADAAARPVYFVLGNHDFYHGSIAGVRNEVAALSARNSLLCWLPCEEPIAVTYRWALVGHDGWADGCLGDYLRSVVMMNDYLLIDEFRGLDKVARGRQLEAQAQTAAEHLRQALPRALALRESVLVLTHVPPFRDACWHEGRISDDQWLPHFSSQIVGQTLLEAAAAHPKQRILVLCGHTHGAGRCWPLPNLEVRTGGAEYGRPQVQEVLELE